MKGSTPEVLVIRPLTGAARRRSRRATSAVGGYRDFVIGVRRLDARKVAVTVDASPAGRLDRFVTVVFPEKEATALRDSFVASLSGKSIAGGRMMITPAEASVIGNRLAQILFPGEVFGLFATSLSSVLAAASGGPSYSA